MGVEFRIGRQDSLKVENFLARTPEGVSSIVLDTAYAKYQAGAAEAARDANIDVFYDPATERMADMGFAPAGLAYFDGTPFDLLQLRTQAAARTRLVTQVIDAQPAGITKIIPPHFLVHDDHSASLNIALAEETALRTQLPVRACLLVTGAYLTRKHASAGRTPEQIATRLAREYCSAGITSIELRVTPLGGDNESVLKIKKTLAAVAEFRELGLEVVLGFSGNIGQTAVALGHVDHYSVGIGLREQVNHANAITRQKTPPKEPVEGEDAAGHFGAVAGIYLPGPAITVGRKAGKALLAHTDIRTRIGCRLGVCGTDVAGPSKDPRQHYLHARAAEMAVLLARPAAWRPTAEADRLRRALEQRRQINDHYLPADMLPLKTGTLESLINDIEAERLSA